MKSKSSKSEKPSWPPETFAPLGGPAVRIIRRGADGQLRLVWHPTIGAMGALDCRIFRKSPNVEDLDEEYSPTSAGICVSRDELRTFAGMILEIAAELER